MAHENDPELEEALFGSPRGSDGALRGEDDSDCSEPSISMLQRQASILKAAASVDDEKLVTPQKKPKTNEKNRTTGTKISWRTELHEKMLACTQRKSWAKKAIATNTSWVLECGKVCQKKQK